ncbi:hypothetical protein N0V82_009026 [Gnomoniopsis sp. IMI 355080]|nr:hypothetical protein N0V82_009026 [Gnomoniopsis sp. IMI 355080]
MQTANPVSINAELYQNSSCLPPDVFPYDTNCTLGSYPPYSVNVSNVAQIQLAVNFARNLDLRLVVKNTGHDFNAKSTGAGALAIWTHNLKDTQYYPNFTTTTYSGAAFKLGAGIQGNELYEACHEHGVTCIGGEGRTVGMMGGFTQGGGHSPLSSLYGLGADQALAFEVVTADGRFLTASEDENDDLFWALRGGGGGTFGVVTSAIVKAYPKLPCATLSFTIERTRNVTEEMFWGAAKAYWDGFVKWTDAGTYSYFYMYPAGAVGLTADTWLMMPWFAPNVTQIQLEELVAPLFANFSSLGLTVMPTYAEYDNFYDAWNTAFPLEFWGINVGRQAGRFFPYENWANDTINNASFEAVKSVFLDGAYIYGFHMAPGGPLVTYPENAVNPAWRQTVGHIMLGGTWDATDWANETGMAKIAEVSYNVTHVWGERWRKVAPNSGCYLSESDYLEPNFQTALWGSNYERLYEIKTRYDPWGLFYARRGVASDEWETDEEIVPGLPSQAGRLCRV